MTTAQQDPTISKSQKVKGIRSNRLNEKAENRKLESFELERNSSDSGKKAEVIPIKKDILEDASFPSNIELLRRKQRERMGKNNEGE